MAGEQHELESIFDLVDAVFDGDAGHDSHSFAALGLLMIFGLTIDYRNAAQE